MVSIMHDNKNIEGSPFTIRVYDPGRVKVFGLQDSGDTGGPVQFSGQYHCVMCLFVSLSVVITCE